jgi:hypothetical protein
MSNECNAINCLIAKTNKINKKIDDYSWTIETSATIDGPITSGPLKIKNKDKVKFIGDISVKKGSVIVDFTKLSNISTNITYFTGANEVKSITEPGLVFLEGINGQYTINPGECNDGDIINILKSKNQEGWFPIINGVAPPDGTVYSILKYGDTLYIGGSWTNELGNVPNTARLAKYVDGATGWQPVIEGVAPPDNIVLSIVKYGDTLYIGGNWSNNLGVLNTEFLAKYVDGATGWQPVIEGIAPPDNIVLSIVKYGDTLYIGGNWSNNLGVQNTEFLAKYVDGATGWQPVIEGIAPPYDKVFSIVKYGDTLYIGGDWTNELGGVQNTTRLAKYVDGATGWQPVVEGVAPPDGAVLSILKDSNGTLYIGGYWGTNLGVSLNTKNLAKYVNGATGWQPVVEGVAPPDGSVLSIVKYGDTLYIGGDWSNKLGNVLNTEFLAKYVDGSTGWQPVIEGVAPPTNTVRSILKDSNGTLYIGGDWTNNLGNVPNTARLAKYVDGSTGWQPVIKGVAPPSGEVLSILKDSNGTLYIGGDWTNELGNVSNTKFLAKLNSTTVTNDNTSYLMNNISNSLKFICRDNNYIKVNNI